MINEYSTKYHLVYSEINGHVTHHMLYEIMTELRMLIIKVN